HIAVQNQFLVGNSSNKYSLVHSQFPDYDDVNTGNHHCSLSTLRNQQMRHNLSTMAHIFRSFSSAGDHFPSVVAIVYTSATLIFSCLTLVSVRTSMFGYEAHRHRQ